MVFFNTTLETERMILRGFNQQSYDQLFSSANDSEISEVLGVSTAEELELEKARYKGGYSTYNLTIQFFQLVAKEDNRILGWCGYHSWAKQHRRAEIFYMIKSDDDKRKGLMSEALGKALEYGKTEMNLRRIEAFVATDNPASYRLLEKFGFKKEAEIQFRYQFGDEVDWDYLYSLIWE